MSNDAATSDHVFLETINPNDMTEQDLIDLAVEMASVSDLDVEVGYFDQHGAGVTWLEVLHLWIPTADFLRDHAWDLVLQAAVANLRKRFKRKGSARRPKVIVVLDWSSGDVLEKWTLDREDAEPSREEPGPRDHRQDRPPPRRNVQARQVRG